MMGILLLLLGLVCPQCEELGLRSTLSLEGEGDDWWHACSRGHVFVVEGDITDPIIDRQPYVPPDSRYSPDIVPIGAAFFYDRVEPDSEVVTVTIGTWQALLARLDSLEAEMSQLWEQWRPKDLHKRRTRE